MRKLLLGLLLCLSAVTASAAVQEFPLKRDAAGNIISSCDMSWDMGTGWNIYITEAGGTVTKLSVPNSQSTTPPLRFGTPCPVLPAGQYTWGMTTTEPGVTESVKTPGNAFNIVDPLLPTGPPVLAFTDLTAGPRGAFVTVWGTNLGTAAGALTLGGVPQSVVYWGNATPPSCGPANLFNTYQKMQCVIFKVDGVTPTGAQTLAVTVGGKVANSLPFTVATTGTVKFLSPGANLGNAMDSLVAGDILYLRGGSYGAGWPGYVSQTGNPSAVVAYPLEAVIVGSGASASFEPSHSGSGYTTTYSKLAIFGTASGRAIALASGVRAVGNFVIAPLGAGSSGAIAGDPFHGASGIAILGNELTNVGDPSSAGWDPLYHVVYLAGPRGQATLTIEAEREVGWNYFHDNAAARAINIFNAPSRTSDVMSAAITKHRIHDNVIVNQVWDGILLGAGVIGENWILNNTLVNVGVLSPTGAPGGGGINVRASDPLGFGQTTPTGQPLLLHLVGNAVTLAAPGILMFAYAAPGILDMHDNVFTQTGTMPYMAPGSQTPPLGTQSYKNTWVGAGPAPPWDNTTVTPPLVFAIGAKVKTVVALTNVRATPGGVILATQIQGRQGTIIGGPQVVNGGTWWQVDFSTGADGWVLEALLSLVP